MIFSKYTTPVLWSGVFLLSSLFLWGCSSSSKLTHEDSCNQKFDKLHKSFLDKKYSAIREPLLDLVSTCNGSKFIEQALFELAESHYHLKEWYEAQLEYSNLLQNYPASKYAESAQYKLAQCSSEQIYSVNRDQAKTTAAIQDFELFLLNHPESAKADSARMRISFLRKRLLQKDLNIASLYLKMHEPQATAIYLKSIIENYPNEIDTKDIYVRLVRCYVRLNQFEQADSYLAKLTQVDNNDPFYPKIKSLQNEINKAKDKHNKKIARSKGLKEEP